MLAGLAMVGVLTVAVFGAFAIRSAAGRTRLAGVPGSPSVTSRVGAPAESAQPSPNPTATENRLPGSPRPVENPDGHGIAGYADAASVTLGETINFMVSSATSTFQLDLYRMGSYGGAGSRQLATISLPGQNQGYWLPNGADVKACPSCRADPLTGLVDASWKVSYSLRIPSNWVSGNYLAKLTTPKGDRGYIYFVVREDSRPSAILAVMPVNTYQAYSDWGGASLYSNHGRPSTLAHDRAVKVSFNRPYNPSVVTPGMYDFQVAEFLEQAGYDVTYATSVDIDRDPSLLLRHRVFLSIGHDEYWSRKMRVNVERARDSGIDLAFFGGNDVYRQVRYESDAEGRDYRVLVCYKSALLDPIAESDPRAATIEFVKAPLNWPQNELTGTLANPALPHDGAPWIVAPTAPQWLLVGTGLSAGEAVPKLFFYECDREAANNAEPAKLRVLSYTYFAAPAGQSTTCNSTWYVTAHHSEVFGAGTIGWAIHIADPRVRQMTKNILNRFTGNT